MMTTVALRGLADPDILQSDGPQHLTLHLSASAPYAWTALGLGATFVIRGFGPTKTRMGRLLPMSGAGYLLMFLELEILGRFSK